MPRLGNRNGRPVSLKVLAEHLNLSPTTVSVMLNDVPSRSMRHRDFIAVLCFNDITAIEGVRALHDAGVRVLEDVSVVGFDDIQTASLHVPSLRTIRQPLALMGATAATLLLRRIRGEHTDSVVKIGPELVTRESTARHSEARTPPPRKRAVAKK